MNNIMFRIIAVCVLVLTFNNASLASDVVLTPFGQSPDALMIKVVLKKLGIKGQLNKKLTAGDLTNEKVLVTVVAGSSKGLGAAGIDKDAEIERMKNVVEAAKAKGIKVLVMHIGGKGRRGKLTDMFIMEAVSMADKIIVVEGGDYDGFFKKLLEGKDTEMLPAKSIRGTSEPLKKILTEWGIL